MADTAHDFNPATGLSREQYRDNWMSSGIGNMDQMQQWLQQNGGSVLSGNGTVQTPYGDTLDMGTAFRTGNGTPGWTPVSGGQQSMGSIGMPQGQGSILGMGGGNMLGSLLQMLQGGGQQQNPGAMPYDPHAGNQPMYGKAGGMQQPMQPNQTNGTVLGTSPTGGQLNNTSYTGTPIGSQPSSGTNSWMQPSGMASFYKPMGQSGTNGQSYSGMFS